VSARIARAHGGHSPSLILYPPRLVEIWTEALEKFLDSEKTRMRFGYLYDSLQTTPTLASYKLAPDSELVTRAIALGDAHSGGGVLLHPDEDLHQGGVVIVMPASSSLKKIQHDVLGRGPDLDQLLRSSRLCRLQ